MNIVQSSWFDSLRRIETANDSARVFAAIEEATARLGFQYWSYGARPRRALDHGNVRVCSNYPLGWMSHYSAQGYLDIDTSVSLAANRSTTVDWVEARAAGGRRLWADADDFGLRIGLAHPSWDATGMFGLLSVSRGSETIASVEFEAIAPQLAWLSGLAHAKLQKLADRSLDESVSLTERELRILQWTAMGKTAFEIATITGIKPRTVNYHIGNILAKLDVRNKIQAAVRATVMGLL